MILRKYKKSFSLDHNCTHTHAIMQCQSDVDTKKCMCKSKVPVVENKTSQPRSELSQPLSSSLRKLPNRRVPVLGTLNGRGVVREKREAGEARSERSEKQEKHDSIDLTL